MGARAGRQNEEKASVSSTFDGSSPRLSSALSASLLFVDAGFVRAPPTVSPALRHSPLARVSRSWRPFQNPRSLAGSAVSSLNTCLRVDEVGVSGLAPHEAFPLWISATSRTSPGVVPPPFLA